ncbi:transposase [Dactylosporangium darangshiense]|uniref:transposase n=1 Tax=Dactylosporangium darangshiense TaxID=579108 RepID=UPI0036410490
MRTVEQLGWYSVAAAPAMGQSNRRRHVERLHRLHPPTDGRIVPASTGVFELMSTACMLDALSEVAQPLDLRHAPCETLVPQDRASPDRQTGRALACPVWHACQRHEPARRLVEAPVWVATPWSLVYTKVPNHLNAETLRYLEAAWRRSDLILVDEADQVQANLDAMFATGQTLLGSSDDAWIDEIDIRFGAQLRALDRAPTRLSHVRVFNLALNAARAAADIAYHLLQLDRRRPRGVLRKWVDGDYFTEWTLFQQLAEDWAGFAPVSGRRPREGWDRDACYLELRRIFDAFVDSPAGGTGDPVADELAGLAASVIADTDEDQRQARVRNWLTGFTEHDLGSGRRATPVDIDASASRLEFALMVAIIASRLNQMLRLWPLVAADLDLHDLPVAELRQPPRDLTPVVPESPMGNVLGFQYVEHDRRSGDGQMGEFRFFRYSGVGRSLLVNLPNLFPADGSGPNVMLLSGTSWAGTSPRYHVDVEVGGILRPHQKDLDQIAKTTVEFRPFTANDKPISVSGKWGPERDVALQQMVTALAKPGPTGRSLLEKEHAALPDGRQRIMLLVGSYREAKYVAEALVRRRTAWSDNVRYLVPDDEFATDWDGPQCIRRADVATFAATGAWILVTPMLAIERGHNILNDDGVAAIGAAFFLVRPHPRPDDLTYVTQRINQYAQRQIAERARGSAGEPGPEALDEAGRERRRAAQRRWRALLHSRVAYSQLDDDERRSLTWTQLVTIWQVIGRLVRGGQAAKVYFCDAAFAPRTAQRIDGVSDVAGTSLLLGLREVLDPYFQPECTDDDRHLVKALYQPLRQALSLMGDL